MAINYEDKRFQDVKAEEKAELNKVDETYGNMISQSDDYFQKQIGEVQKYADTQKDIQKQQTDFAIEQIEQKKEQANKDYIKEQSGAYVDWQKQSAPHSVNAERTAAAGLKNSGYSESSQVSMYNTYQNRVSAAREAYSRAVLNYDNAIKDAQLQNNATLAQIAYEALQKQLELSLQGFQYKNQLILDQADKKLELKKYYGDKWQRVLDQINTENALAEEARQHDESLKLQREKFEEEIRQFNILHPQDDSANSIQKGLSTEAAREEMFLIKNGSGNNNTQQNTYDQISQKCNDYIAQGASRSEISTYLRNAYNEGLISKSEYEKLKSQFVPTTSGGRYTY